MDLLVHRREQYSHKSVLKHPKRASYQSGSEDYQNKAKNIKGAKGQKSRHSTAASHNTLYNEYYDSRSTNYPSWSVFDGNYNSKKINYDQGYGKYNDQYEQSNYAKTKGGYNKGFFSDNNYSRSTNASSNSDNEGPDFNGFKIMMNGKVLHDETTDDNELCFNTEPVFQSFPTTEKFASSVMTIGPKANEISLPSFM